MDLRVTVDPDKPGVCEFGVEVKGARNIHLLINEHSRVRPHVVRESRVKGMLTTFPFPVALMLFDVKTDEGFFGWLLAPEPSGVRLLKPIDPVSVEPATDETMKKALSEVRRWYRCK